MLQVHGINYYLEDTVLDQGSHSVRSSSSALTFIFLTTGPCLSSLLQWLQWSRPFLRGHPVPLPTVLSSPCWCHGVWLDMTTVIKPDRGEPPWHSPLSSLQLSPGCFCPIFPALGLTQSPHRLARYEADKQPSAYLWDPDCSRSSTLYIHTSSASSPKCAQIKVSFSWLILF